ncbi:hypothetical protein GM3708_3111 [Geminocystis sp. NIES-3708]|uniref:DUF4359 domain-containing protein n=1 Tax=Geminocystis sp. NIES-3708 TaxID=1615909 RepID=UPI0005FC3A6A|nr:DUF4359 domain-containing protein [Geminocystis sp. NIES-3708]BAQ62705.1 hypothetical protein GM3708_3111 [Geminocystis sp. NIES-3708]
MKLPLIPLSILSLLIISAVVTNPDQKKFETFIAEKGSKAIKEDICQSNSQSTGILENFASKACNLIGDTSMELVARFVAENTTRHNYLLFSIYELDANIHHSKTLGLFNNFVILDDGMKDSN